MIIDRWHICLDLIEQQRGDQQEWLASGLCDLELLGDVTSCTYVLVMFIDLRAQARLTP
jgi:hypothetical protein